MRVSIKKLVFGNKVYLSCFLIAVFFILGALFYSNSPIYAQSLICQPATPDTARATGLISAPSLSNASKFGNPSQTCVLDPSKAPFTPFKIPTFDDLKSLYFDQAKSAAPATIIPPPLSNGLVGYWKMDESSWTNDCSTQSIADSSGNSNGGKSCANAGGMTGGTAGKFGNGAVMDGTNDYISVPSSNNYNFGANSFSISIWIKPTDWVNGPFGGYRGIFTKYRTNGLTWNLFRSGSDGTLRFMGFRSDNVTAVFHASVPSSITTSLLNNWHHIVAVRDGDASAKIYIDGVMQSTTVGTPSGGSLAFSPTTSVLIGSYSEDELDDFAGSVDEARIYNRALSPTEVSQLYNLVPGSEKSGQTTPIKDTTTFSPTATNPAPTLSSSTTFNGDTLYYANGNLTVSGNPNPISTGTPVIIVNGDLNISANYTYGSIQFGNPLSGTVFIVKGKVVIDQSVTTINAVIIAEGKIYTATTNSPSLCNRNSLVQTLPLTINGSLISLKAENNIEFCRSISDNSQPAEIINHQVKYLVILRNLLSDTLQKWSEVDASEPLPSPAP